MTEPARGTGKRKNIAIIGLAGSGLSAAHVLRSPDTALYGFDDRGRAGCAEPELFEAIYDSVPPSGDLKSEMGATLEFDYAVISPGVPLESRYGVYFSRRGVEIIGEIELAYRMTDSSFISITGTNGKTTTTALVGEIVGRVCPSARVCGNIGIPATTAAAETQGTVLIAEVSSFQLETVRKYHSAIAAILNITPDHLDRHGSMEKYTALKRELALRADRIVLNADDPILSAMDWPPGHELYYFSRRREVRGAFVRDGKIVCLGEPVCDLSEIPLVGAHNLENVLAASLVAFLYGVPAPVIREGIRNFRAVEHRTEYVRTIDIAGCSGERKRSVLFYNDSKGTNPDSTIKAIESFEMPIHLIAGGFEKGSDYGPMLEIGKGRVASLSLIGATALRFRKAAADLGYEHIRLCADMEEAVRSAFEYARKLTPEADRCVVLLSPASASWGMYENYMKRGEEFKRLVREI